jgi:antitoxin component of MazEF toxin-antitoxin module
MKKLISVFVIGLVATCAVVASPAGAKKGKAHGLAGVVQSVGSSSVTIKPKKGDPVTVQVNGDTKIFVNNKAGALADIKAGFRALVRGKQGEPAKAIRAYQPPAPGTVVVGQVDSVGANSITLKKRDGSTVAIPVNGDTKILVNGKAAKLADVEAGYRAYVRRTAADGPAAVIRAYEKKQGEGQKLLVRGVVDSVGSDSITLKGHGSATLTIHVTAQTIIRVGGQAGALSDIKAGYRTLVLRAGAGGDALAIVAFPPKS